MPTAGSISGKEEEIRKVYEEIYLPLPPTAPLADEMRPYVDYYAPQNRSARILDAGCGIGRWSRYLAERGYTNIDAVDLFKQLEIPGANYHTSSVDDLPFEDDAFDFCVSLSVIHYLDSPKDGLEEIFRVLRPGSILLMTAHTKYSLFTVIRRLKRAVGAKSVGHLKHCRFESVAAYRRYLRAVGFEILQTDGYRTIWASLYRKICRFSASIGSRSVAELKVPPMTRYAFMRAYKAWSAYHAIVVARKP